MNHIAEIIEYEFQREQEYGIKYLIANGPRDELRTSTYPSLNEEFEKLIDQVNENCKAHNKTYSLNYNPIVRFENINPNQTTDVSS
ncbi:MAG: hypothetical protein EOP49_00835 [Sphingobacteriales bacterium]|nr:MAG: hypothetical protein EOP49_00835 [Sphingobacteriales bacterium]